jgi:tetratricopeptide (TPR) repeat protein
MVNAGPVSVRASTLSTTMSDASPIQHRLLYAQVLVELGELHEGERELAGILDVDPKNLTAFNLLARIKHMRGELSQAIACWAQIHAQSPHNELALMSLASILQLVKDPERGASEFLALGRNQVARKPAAQLELEEAFRHFLARRPAEARAQCERLATKYERTDRDLYKLAVLANAWISELSGDLERACAVLEQLGKERGFETDTDRVLALARVYERLGTPAHLERAAHIFRFLDRSFEKLSTLGRLGALYRKLKNAERAEEYERRFLFAFQRRMHRVSATEVATVAARRYLPLAELRRARLIAGGDAEAEAAGDLRERAIREFLRGRDVEARALFEQGGELLDRKYLADLSLLEGDAPRAVAGFAEALTEDPDDERILASLLEHAHRAPGFALGDVVTSGALRSRLVSNVETSLRESPLSASSWRSMAGLRRLLGDEAEAERCAERASALQTAARRDSKTIGRVLAAAVFHFVGKAKGLIHQVWVDRTPTEIGRGGFLASDDILGNVTFEMKQSIRNTFFAVREYARSRFPQQTSDILDYDYAYKVTKEDEPSGGLSAGLPTALAFLSTFLQRPVPQDIAFSGVLIADSHDALVVRSVGEAEYKVKGAYNRSLRMVVLPAENRADLIENPQVPRAVCDEIVRFAHNLDDAVTLTFGEDIWLK